MTLRDCSLLAAYTHGMSTARKIVPLLALTVLTATVACAQGLPAYHISKTVPLGVPDRWDYVVYDRASHRVYVSHGDRVTVVDGRSGALIGQVEGFAGGTHGIAIVTASGRGYTDDGRAGEAGSFDLATLKVQQRIKAAPDADAVTFDPASGHVFVVNGDPGTLTVIDPKADRAVATVETGGKLEYAVADGKGKLFVNGEEKEGDCAHRHRHGSGGCALADPELRKPARPCDRRCQSPVVFQLRQ